MKTANLIPSLSWAYTAGAKYESKGFLASLTFGGYDLSRIIPNNVPFFLAPDISRDLVVGLQSITSTHANASAASLLSSPILTFIDSTLPYIIVPEETCLAFENVFGLMRSTSLDLYVVNDTLHHNLITHNPSFTFRIADSIGGGPTVDIVMPYASFDLSIDHPLLPDNTNYFPLKRAQDSSQYTLGRTFLQEAYLITNYEYSNFSVSQTRFEEGLRENIIAIPPSTSATPTNVQGHISHNTVIGASLSATVVFLVSVFGIALTILRWRHKKSKIGNRDATELSEESPNPEALIVLPIQEIDANSICGPREVPDTGIVELRGGRSMLELEESPRPIRYELMANQDSAGHMMTQDHNARNKFAIFTATGLLRGNWPTVGTNDETIISASPLRGLQDLNRSLPPTPISESPQVWPFETVISTSHPRGIQDLDPSLPPTPVPESLQVRPVRPAFSRQADKKKSLRKASSAASIGTSIIGGLENTSPRTIHVQIARALSRSDYVLPSEAGFHGNRD
ncbi:MAG: hypothetical protein ALECFALPRED_001671 [Alectoria fallacina]|uniref:Peptidase A1 domain-containing protein n=1 Tax=Alectoria fallacina TaxID=1903189 RepID=A0A8H3IP92_9LECA|nr:MAG: hypothetical protein ALECFALPRED_001671 [Alectoria fallacina]